MTAQKVLLHFNVIVNSIGDPTNISWESVNELHPKKGIWIYVHYKKAYIKSISNKMIILYTFKNLLY